MEEKGGWACCAGVGRGQRGRRRDGWDVDRHVLKRHISMNGGQKILATIVSSSLVPGRAGVLEHCEQG